MTVSEVRTVEIIRLELRAGLDGLTAQPDGGNQARCYQKSVLSSVVRHEAIIGEQKRNAS